MEFSKDFDKDKLEERLDRVNENITIILENNPNAGYCPFCGAERKEGVIAIGPSCLKQLTALFKKYAQEESDDDFKEKYNAFKLQIYLAKAKKIKNFWLKINSDKNGAAKKFRSDFKKNFYSSIKNQEKISKKQLEVMISDIERAGKYDADIYTTYLDLTEEIEKEQHQLFANFSHNDSILRNKSFIKYAHITYANAWLKEK